MAENVNVTPGSGAIVSTDEVTINSVNVQVQRVKLVESFEGSGAELSKREDAPHVSGDPGFMLLAVRKDTATGLASADNDYHPLEVDSSGRLHVNAGVVPAASRATDSVAIAHSMDAIMQNLTARSPAFAVIDYAVSGNNALVGAQGSGNIICVHSLFIVATSAVTVRFQSGASGTNLTGAMALAANSGFVLPFNPVGWFRTNANATLNLSLGGSVNVSGSLVYTVVT